MVKENEQKRDLPTVNEGWEERFAQFGLGAFDVSVTLAPEFAQLLTADEDMRTFEKLRLVEEFATKLALGMLKGSLKYGHDRWDDEQWANAAEDEESDLVNYRLLRKEERERRESASQERMAEAWKGVMERELDAPKLELDMHEIARRNGFRLEGDRLIQTDF